MPRHNLLARLLGRPVLLAPPAAPALLDSLSGADRGGDGLLAGLGRLLSGGASAREPRRAASDEAGAGWWHAPRCAPDAEYQEAGFFLSGHVAVIEIVGVLYDRSVGWGDSYEEIGAQIRAARADERVRGIFLSIDSPGGLVDGLFELLADISAGSARHGGKPIWGFAGGSAFSAAYGVISACDRIIASPEGEVGSIGAVLLHANEAKWLERIGIEITPIEFPEGKTDGAWWAALSETARADLSARIRRAADLFIAHVEAHRPALDAAAIIELRARVFGADDADPARSARALGLIDEIAFERAALAALTNAVGEASAVPAPLAQTAAAQGSAAGTTSPATKGNTMPKSMKDRLAALQKAAARGDADAKARLAELQTLLSEEEDENAEGEDDDANAEGDDESEAEGNDDDVNAEDEDEDEEGQVDAKTARAILGCAEARGRDKLAAKLATTPGMTVKTARGILAAAPRAGGKLASQVLDPKLTGDGGGKSGQARTGNVHTDAALSAFAKSGQGHRIRKPA